MGTRCAVKNCLNRQGKGTGTSFHRFPQDPERARNWAIVVGREDLLDKDKTSKLYESHRVCSIHFDDSHFLNDRYLLSSAIPTIFPSLAGSKSDHTYSLIAEKGPQEVVSLDKIVISASDVREIQETDPSLLLHSQTSFLEKDRIKPKPMLNSTYMAEQLNVRTPHTDSVSVKSCSTQTPQKYSTKSYSSMQTQTPLKFSHMSETLESVRKNNKALRKKNYILTKTVEFLKNQLIVQRRSFTDSITLDQ